MAIKLAKIAVTAEADKALDELLSKVNDEFRGGKVGKQELASWAIMHFARESIDRCLDAIRAAYFDEVAYLGAVMKELRSARRSGGALADIRTMLAPLVGRQETSGRAPRPRKAATADSSTTPHQESQG